MATRMQQRRGTAAQWISTNSGNGPILAAGEVGFESDTNKFKIGDGVNHWVDLTYFTDADSIMSAVSGLVDGAPDLLNTLNEIAAAIGDNPNFLEDYATTQYVIDALGNAEVDQSTLAGVGIDWNGATSQFDIDSTVATKTFAAQLLTNATKTNIAITGDATGLTITAENGVADSTTDNLTEGSTNKYFTDERAQDAIGNNLGTGLSYDDALGAISVNTSTIQARVANISDTEIGYLDGVTSAIQTQINNANTAINGKLSLSGGTMTGDLTLAGAPSADLHPATKAYVDNVVAGINFHQPVRVATTANITLSGTQTIDGVSLSVGDRVLVKDQTDQKTNGIYVVGSSTWSRATDADNTPAGELAGGDFCLVLEGTVGSGYGYVCSNTSAITIGSSNITYAAYNAAKAVVAGNGLTETTPGTIAIDTSITQTRVSGVSDTEIGYLDGVTSAIQTQLDAKAPAASPTFTGTVTLPTGTVTSGMILDGTIVNADINASAAIDWTKLAVSSTISATELGYLDGVTSAIQTQLDAKVAKSEYTAKGGILVGTGSGTYTLQSVGTNGQVLAANSAQADGVEWITPAQGAAFSEFMLIGA